MAARTIREQGEFRVERTALGQVTDYAVYEGEKFLGSGSKKEALKLFATATKAAAKAAAR